ncbi:MAG: hypothetical protein LUG12_03170 [Erysipelotrichaceae bacterium]|nr:hypothetical protein [Erysipelotrichaceae bacterium]
MNYIKEHFEETKSYLYDELDYVKNILALKDDEEFESHNLYYYAVYLLVEMKDKGGF